MTINWGLDMHAMKHYYPVRKPLLVDTVRWRNLKTETQYAKAKK
jgi:hypothetical protein